MNCQEFESTLNEVLDRREDPRLDKRVVSHASLCQPCADSLEFYAAMGDYGEPVNSVSLSSRRQLSGYVMAVTAAALLFLLLGPLGEYFSPDDERINLAHANHANVHQSETPGVRPDSAKSFSRQRPEFWDRNRLEEMVASNGLGFQIPRTPNFQEVGQSINSVWKSIQEDEYLVPLIKQGALFWMP